MLTLRIGGVPYTRRQPDDFHLGSEVTIGRCQRDDMNHRWPAIQHRLSSHDYCRSSESGFPPSRDTEVQIDDIT